MFYAKNPNNKWTNFISTLTRVLNFSMNVNTGRSFNEIVISFTLNNSFDVVFSINGDAREFELKRKIYQNEARDCYAYAQLNIKIRYDRVYTPLLFNAGDKVYLNLYEDYRIPDIKNKKLTR